MKIIVVAILSVIFFVAGYVLLEDSLPQKKAKIYTELKQYMPYKLEKRIGGFSIINQQSGEKIKPPASEVFKELDWLEAKWGREHLVIKGDKLLVHDNSQKVIATIKIKSKEEMRFLRSFFDIIPK